MAMFKAIGEVRSDEIPVVRKITVSDLMDCLRKGFDDFKEWPTHLVMVAITYPIVGLFAARIAFGYDVLPLLFPLVSGFALVAPLCALGLYELSRLRESHEEVSWKRAFEVRQSHSILAIERLAILLAAVFFTWLVVAQLIFSLTVGDISGEGISGFINTVFFTREGWQLITIGCSVGFVFALGVFSIIVVSFPLLLDRDTTASIAVVTSVRAVAENMFPMAVWGLIVAGLLILGSIPLFLGLAVIMPILGHATWHLYRAVIVHD